MCYIYATRQSKNIYLIFKLCDDNTKIRYFTVKHGKE